ncbi:MAG: nitroreductase family protein [Spirochaetales bacterium]
MERAQQTIAARLSCRAYSGEPLGDEHTARIESLISEDLHGPLGTPVRVSLVENSPVTGGELEGRFSYGSAHGAPLLLVPMVPRSRHAMEDLGAVVERIILELEAEGIASCWFAGNFSESRVAREAGAGSEELLPAVVTIGYRAHRRTASEGPARFSVGARKRKPWQELFFELEFWDDEQRPHGPPTPLTPQDAPDYQEMLDAVRLAPSTSNSQPWRFFRYSSDSGPDELHLFMRRNAGMDKVIRDIDIQKVDIGAAMAHFKAVAEELRMDGQWIYNRPRYLPAGVEYMATWEDG